MSGVYRGANRYRTFLKAGRTITRKISKLNGVVGILGTGSIGRRFGDRFSDLDLTVYAEDAALRDLRRLVSIGWISYKNMPYDILVESYDKASRAGVPSKYWTQVQRWHHQNSQILFDPEKRVEQLLRQKLVYPERERTGLLKRYQLEVQEHLVFFPEMWAERGELYNVIETLTQAVRYMLLWICARNAVFEPFMEKWPFYHLETKAVPEHVHLSTLTRIYTDRNRTLTAVMKCRQELLSLCEQIGLRWEVNSTVEALERCRRSWSRISDETKRLLAW